MGIWVKKFATPFFYFRLFWRCRRGFYTGNDRQNTAPARYFGFRDFRYSGRNPTGRTGRPCLQDNFSNTHPYPKSPLDPPLIGNGGFSLLTCSQNSTKSRKIDFSAKTRGMTQISPGGRPGAGCRRFGRKIEDPASGCQCKMPWRPILKGRFLTKIR